MASKTYRNPNDDPARAQVATPAPSAGQMENFDQLAEDLGLVPRKPRPQDDRARTQAGTAAPSAGQTENLDQLAEQLGFTRPQPVSAEVQPPPDDRA